jgi:hypothetical protein
MWGRRHGEGDKGGYKTVAIEDSVEEKIEDGRWVVMKGLKGLKALKGLTWTLREYRNHKLRRKEA